MKRLFGKREKVTKGMPSAVLLSIVIHAALFLLAGMLVVFTVVKKKEVEFEPPPAVERPKMKLKKPKVKIRKSSRPKPTQRIVTRVNNASMPDIQLPEMSGMGGDGLGEVLGGFDTMPDLGEVSVFGSGQSIGNDLEATFYDFKRYRTGRLYPMMDTSGVKAAIERYIRSGWKASALSKFYRSPKKLYSPTIFMGAVPSLMGPWAFDEPDSAGYNWMVHYKGQIVHPEGGRFRFWGMGDNWLVVRVGGRVVLDFGNQWKGAWDGEASKRTSYHMAHWSAWKGPWFELEPGVPLEMEAILGEYTGGLTAAMLAVEEEGVEYPNNFENGPKLPIFKTAELTRDQIDMIVEYMYEDHYEITNGPVFSDYGSSRISVPPAEGEVAEDAVVEQEEPKSRSRIWTLQDGRTIEAELVVQMGDKLVLKTAPGKQIKIQTREFSAEDLDYVELENPPPLKITFLRDVDKIQFPPIPLMPSAGIPNFYELTTGVKIEKTNLTPYTRKLKAELFTFASEIDGDNYVLLDRVEDTFSFNEATGNTFELWGNKAVIRDYQDGGFNRRGERYSGHMILVTDERGEIIARDVSNPWMLEIHDFLETFPVGRHFSTEGKRTFPPFAEPHTSYW